MESFSKSFTDTFQVVLVLGLLTVFILWWWVFYLLFARKKDNVNRASFMTIAFLCLLCEMARIFDPFTRWRVWSNETLRSFLTLELLLMLTLLLIASDVAAWLNYFSVENLLLKPQRRYRHAIYIGLILLFIQSIIVITISTFHSENSRGVTIGWLLSALIMVFIGLFSMLQSLREVAKAKKLEEKTFCENEEVANAIFIQSDYKEEDIYKRSKSKKKSLRIAKYLSCVAMLFIFDLCFGSQPSGGDMDLIHLMYDILLKILLAIMLFQRRPITETRPYERDIHQRYKPFDERIFSGCDATRTVYKLQEMVRVKTQEIEKKKAMQNKSESDDYENFPKAPVAPPIDNRQFRSCTLPLEGADTGSHVPTESTLDMDMRVRPPIEVVNSNGPASNDAETTAGQFEAGADTEGKKIENVKVVEAEAETENRKVENVKDVKSKGLSNEPAREDASIEAARKQSYEF